MKKPLNFIKFPIFSLFFLAIGLTSCKSGIDIDSTEEVKEFVTGKWHDETVESGGVITYYRFEITDTEIKCWKSHLIMSNNGVSSDNVTDDWEEQAPVALSIGSVETNEADNKFRNLGNCSYGTYKVLCYSRNGGTGETYIKFKDNNSINSDTECTLDKGWEY
ncbi:hypothetical protein [Flavobacterium johnsoniae]|uniref:Lipoprotein n=1 Tax=Flavobacterium johnsoniae TaxID=986 RepID=A0A1M5G7W6_FLAJO|nr:hypothetical protein [Flavobacterium johnsoniae]SHF99857.1 hypothetical protein SAMN05444388_101293 [Flavobacterium johnsoniae]